MARYDYRCSACHHVFEVEHSMDTTPLVTCPRCGHKAERVFEPSGISLKGSGFYNTDSRTADSKPPKKSTKTEENASSHKSSGDESSSHASSQPTANEPSAKDSTSASSTTSDA